MNNVNLSALDPATLASVTGGATRFYETADEASAMANRLHAWNSDTYYQVKRGGSQGLWYVTVGSKTPPPKPTQKYV